LSAKWFFLSGPRQCGKTTLAQSLIQNKFAYFNWDSTMTKRQWTKDPVSWGKDLIQKDISRVVLDEFHKNQK